MPDNVKQPSHYTSGDIETIDYIHSQLSPEQWYGYCIGNVIKYTSRNGKKPTESVNEDLKKAEVYLRWAEAGKPVK